MNIKTVNVTTLKNWLNNNEALVIDVREPAEYEAENIKGSKLIPLSIISKNTLPEGNGKKLVIHCRSGKRSTNACEKLLAEDPNLEIYNLERGILAWIEAKNLVQTSGKLYLPLDRQVQLVVGICVFLGSLFTHFFNPLFFLFTAFIGLGLGFAGLTGFCGLAKLMAKMPWNQNCKNSSYFGK